MAILKAENRKHLNNRGRTAIPIKRGKRGPTYDPDLQGHS